MKVLVKKTIKEHGLPEKGHILVYAPNWTENDDLFHCEVAHNKVWVYGSYPKGYNITDYVEYYLHEVTIYDELHIEFGTVVSEEYIRAHKDGYSRCINLLKQF